MMYLFESVEIKTALHNYSSWLPAEIIKKKNFFRLCFSAYDSQVLQDPKAIREL